MAAAPTDRRARRRVGARASVVPAGLAGAPIDVFFLLLPDSLVLDWAGPAEALRSANRHLEALGQPACALAGRVRALAGCCIAAEPVETAQ